VFERLPGQFEHDPLLRVHQSGLTRCDAEKVGVESGHIIEVSAAAGDAAHGGGVVVSLPRVPVPAAGRDIGDRVSAVAQQFPELLRRVDATSESAGHAYDGDRLARIHQRTSSTARETETFSA
jgi:phage tail tape-measure protein